MKILLVTPFLPYPGVPHAGGKLVFHLLATLSRNHQVFLVSRCFPAEEVHLAALRGIVSGMETVPVEGPIRTGSIVSLFHTVRSYRQLATKAREVLERQRFDLLQVEYTETAVFLRPPKGIPSALSLHDVMAKPAFRRYEGSRGSSWLWGWSKWKAISVLEGRAVSVFGVVFTLSEVDREWAARLYPGVPFRVLRYPAGLEFRGLPREEVPGRILFAGAMNRPQNVEAVRYLLARVWPAVQERVPGAEFWVAGGGMDAGLAAELTADSRIRVTGRVDDLEGFYKSASVFVAPILAGGGVIVKILDALAAGVPVVTTPFGNEGIGAKDGEEILVADRPERFLDHVLSLLGDPDRRRAIGGAGRRFVKAQFSEERYQETLDSACRELLRK